MSERAEFLQAIAWGAIDMATIPLKPGAVERLDSFIPVGSLSNPIEDERDAMNYLLAAKDAEIAELQRQLIASNNLAIQRAVELEDYRALVARRDKRIHRLRELMKLKEVMPNDKPAEVDWAGRPAHAVTGAAHRPNAGALLLREFEQRVQFGRYGTGE